MHPARPGGRRHGGVPDDPIRISGHTDSGGKGDNNLNLSIKRAEAVKAYLVKHGVAADRVETVGYGPDKPVGDNTSKQGRDLNRRIEFELLPGPQVVVDPNAPPPPPPPPTPSPDPPGT